MRKILFAVVAATLALGAVASPAQAYWHRGGWYGGGIGFGFFAPPVVIGPPVVYAPPPVYYAPAPVYAPPPVGQTCYAGAYICPLDRPVPVGGGCSCPTNGGRAYGRSR